MSFFLLSVFLLAFIGFVTATKSEGYRFKLNIGNPNIYCPSPNYTCENGKLHYLCRKTNSISNNCVGYQPIPVTKRFKKSFVQGTNGLRNKIAYDLGISNMNIVYWSDELSAMATRYLRECSLEADPCMIIGERYIKVSQNRAFFKGQGQVTDRLPGRIVRHWYLEIGTDIKNWRDYKKMHISGKLNDLTNFIYPLTEFIGCSGARMFDGYFLICYYHPPYVRSTFPQNFLNGQPCTNCNKSRFICSKTFTGLCGIDYELSGKTISSSNIFLLVVCVSLVFSKIFSFRE